MKNYKTITTLIVVLFLPSLLVIAAQSSVVILSGAELNRVVPTSFYFQGQSAPTQMRNSAAARFGTNRYVIAGFVDTSGYAAEVRAKYQGFLITDAPIKINDSELGVGAYGFGFSNDGKLNVLDLAGNQIYLISTTKDSGLQRPRPLMMSDGNGATVRLYAGKDYVTIALK